MSTATDWTRATNRGESTVSAYEAKTHLSALLERANKGETITITKHGNPIALLTPVGDTRPDVAGVIARIRELRRRSAPLGPELTIRQLIDEGKRY